MPMGDTYGEIFKDIEEMEKSDPPDEEPEPDVLDMPSSADDEATESQEEEDEGGG